MAAPYHSVIVWTMGVVSLILLIVVTTWSHKHTEKNWDEKDKLIARLGQQTPRSKAWGKNEGELFRSVLDDTHLYDRSMWATHLGVSIYDLDRWTDGKPGFVPDRRLLLEVRRILVNRETDRKFLDKIEELL